MRSTQKTLYVNKKQKPTARQIQLIEDVLLQANVTDQKISLWNNALVQMSIVSFWTIRTISNVLENQYVLMIPTKTLKNVKVKILVLRILSFVFLFVTLQIHLLLVFHFYVQDLVFLQIQFVKKLKTVNMNLFVITKFGCLMTVSKESNVVLIVFAETTVEN